MEADNPAITRVERESLTIANGVTTCAKDEFFAYQWFLFSTDGATFLHFFFLSQIYKITVNFPMDRRKHTHTQKQI